ncbi:hypothetical protein [Arcticibacterium luteifluviistationis]|uniref:Phosphoribosylanthranilate isomerase n=1 Tax=Arcticibacterium luteifluviistationis TaxID=1784714 RepID=A0A2Z4GBB3_9BACT|nr:hypothetical protein [Arcticibacterium luteifluviistationis]AWV98411.1 hypothetical protein DJ013_09590 [Arcticibacterium luteifluviistationis]
MLKKEVLVNGISNLSDARYCAGMFVDYLCFELNADHPDFIPVEKMVEIKNWVSGPKIGGRISNWPEELTNEQWQDLGLDFIIIDDISLINASRARVGELFFEVKESSDTQDLDNFEHILISDDSLVGQINHASLFVGGNIGLDNLEEKVENEAIKGLALKGNHEDKPGESKYEDLMDVLEALEEED